MVTMGAQIREARRALGPVAGALAALEAQLLASHAWGLDRTAMLRFEDAPVDPAPLMKLVERRLKREPVAQIVGRRDFWNDTFRVSSAVLTPRPDSETLIETLLRLRPMQHTAYRMLDLGTGSGCLLLSALGEYPNATGVGVDQSDEALQLARRNAAALKRTGRAEFLRSNWCEHLLAQRFDVVLANPPYIPTETIAGLDSDVRDYEPLAALDGGTDGLDCYRSILQQLLQHLNPGALVLFEVGMDQAVDVAALAAGQFECIDIVPDLAGIPRVVALTTKHTHFNQEA